LTGIRKGFRQGKDPETPPLSSATVGPHPCKGILGAAAELLSCGFPPPPRSSPAEPGASSRGAGVGRTLRAFASSSSPSVGRTLFLPIGCLASLGCTPYPPGLCSAGSQPLASLPSLSVGCCARLGTASPVYSPGVKSDSVTFIPGKFLLSPYPPSSSR
jgi:hypothetical protein